MIKGITEKDSVIYCHDVKYNMIFCSDLIYVLTLNDIMFNRLFPFRRT